MFKRFITLAILALTSVGCATAEEPSRPTVNLPTVEPVSIPSATFTIDSAMSVADQEAVLTAIAGWNTVAAGRFELNAVIDDDVSDGDLLTIRTVEKEDLVDCLPETAPEWAYVVGCSVGGVRLMHDHPNQAHNAAHEIGHMLGLGHSDVEGSIMAPMSNSNSLPTSADADAVVAVQPTLH